MLQRQLESSAPLDRITELNQKVDQLTAKYDGLLANQQRLVRPNTSAKRLPVNEL